LYDIKKKTVKNNNLAVICDKMAKNQLLKWNSKIPWKVQTNAATV
jgi:hypothetical protein